MTAATRTSLFRPCTASTGSLPSWRSGDPLLIAVDDVQWADYPSLRHLLYLSRRLEGLAVAVVVAERTGEKASLTLDELRETANARIEPQPLSASGATQLARSIFDADYPPGPRAPRLHQTLRFNADFVGFMESCLRRYGDVFTVRPCPYSAYVAATAPDDIQAVLFDKERFIRGSSADLIKPIAGDRSVIFLSGEDHMRQRKLLLPPFHGERVRRWTERIEAIAAAELERLPPGAPIPLRPVMQRITFEVICRLVFGMEDPPGSPSSTRRCSACWTPASHRSSSSRSCSGEADGYIRAGSSSLAETRSTA
jgi:hypothetical protein